MPKCNDACEVSKMKNWGVGGAANALDLRQESISVCLEGVTQVVEREQSSLSGNTGSSPVPPNQHLRSVAGQTHSALDRGTGVRISPKGKRELGVVAAHLFCKQEVGVRFPQHPYGGYGLTWHDSAPGRQRCGFKSCYPHKRIWCNDSIRAFQVLGGGSSPSICIQRAGGQVELRHPSYKRKINGANPFLPIELKHNDYYVVNGIEELMKNGKKRRNKNSM